jgi:uncharacterized membrane protein
MTQDATDSGRPPYLTRIQIWFCGLSLLGYTLLSYYSDAPSAPRDLAVALAVVPILLIGFVLTWRWSPAWLAIIAMVLTTAAICRYWGFLKAHYEIANLVEQSGAYALVGLAFARSLGHGRVPLSTSIALRLHGTLDAREMSFNRNATLTWAFFYMSIAATIVVLHFFATLQVWSLFVNFATFALIACASVVDLGLRRWLLPRRNDDGVLATMLRALVG